MSDALKWIAVIGGIGAAAFLAFFRVDAWVWFLLLAVLALPTS